MKYETRNHVGLGLLIVGGLIACAGLLLTQGAILVVTIIAGVGMVAAGGYMMTRAFTEADTEHPDYDDFQRRVQAHEERKRQQQP